MEKRALSMIDEFHVKEKTKGCWIEICYANVLILLCCSLAFFFAPLSFAVVFLVMLYLELGLHGFILKHIRKEPVQYEDLFVSPKLFFKNFVLKLIYYATILLWGLLFIVPGIICALNFAFAELICFENPEKPAKQILKESREMMNGFRLKIMLIFMAGLLITCAGVAAGFGIAILFSLWMTVPTWVMIVLMIFLGGVVTAFVSLPLYESFLVSCYVEALDSKKRKAQKNNTKNAKTVGNKK